MILDKSVICPVLIGREAELQTLDQLIVRSREQGGQIALISGEAGIGKSRLLKEIKARVPKETTILEGSCFQAESALPYAPFLDLFRNYLATVSRDAVEPIFKSSGPYLVRLLPELGGYIQSPAAISNPDPKQEKQHTFQALIQVFTELAQKQPLVIVVEDLHWSDATSLDFLLMLIRRIAGLRILVLVTYRSDETNPELTHFLAQLDREHLGTEFSLTRMTSPDVDSMLRAILDLDTPVSQEFLDAIFPLTEGNPFFIEEIIKALITEGDIFYADGSWDRKEISQLRIPRTIQDAVQRRTQKLDDGTLRALTVASVIGRRFNFQLLQELLQADELDLTKMLKDLVKEQLIVEETADLFAFRHALTREAAYATLMLRERQGLHRQVGATLERLYASSIHSHFADLSYHYFTAEEWRKSLEYSLKAGDQACDFYAPREAIIFYSRVLVSARELDLGIESELLTARGRAYETLGDFKSAQDDFEEALRIARKSNDRMAEWKTLIELGSLWAGRNYQRTGEYYQAAEEVSHRLDNPKLQALSLNRLGNWAVNIGQTGQGLELHRQALQIYEQEQDEKGMADTHDLLGMAIMQHGDLAGSFNEYQHAIQLFRKLDDKHGLISALTGSCNTFNWNETNFVPAVSALDNYHMSMEALELTRQTGWAPGEAFVEWTIALNLANRGLFGEAINHASESLRIATEIEHRQWITGAQSALGYIHALMLETDTAVQWFELALAFAKKLGSAWWVGGITASLADVYLLKNELDRTQTLLDTELENIKDNHTLARQRMLWVKGSLLLAKNEAAQALQIAEELLDLKYAEKPEQFIPHILTLKGRALAQLKKGPEALRVLKQAKQGAIQREALPLLWQIHARLGWLYKDMKEVDQSESEFNNARQVLKTLEANIHDEHLQREFMNHALEFMPKEKVVSKRQSEAEKFGGLTTREREVTRYLSQGKSNREIAEILVLSERTVENHVANILNKLGFDSRAQAAVWAVEKGLI